MTAFELRSMNTWGLRSINIETFNQQCNSPLTYPRQARNCLVSFLRTHNLVLNILGYIPITQFFSGLTRMGTGLSIVVLTLCVGNRRADQGLIIGRWYDEALLTGICQIARGALEALVPFGWVINAGLDAGFTVLNLFREGMTLTDAAPDVCAFCPHPDPQYSFPFSVLSLA